MKEEVRILIIDDESAIRHLLKVNLLQKSYKVEEAVNGKTGIERAKEFHPHLILLDLGLPDMNGADVLKELRQWTRVPVVILTVADNEDLKVQLLDNGADDYLTKPFGMNELHARVRVILRNVGLVEATPVFKSNDLEIDLVKRSVCVDGNEVKLTTTEFEVLSRLARENGKVVSQTKIMKQIWGIIAEDQTHYLRIYINQLRKKIEKKPSEPKHIITEAGVGYRLV